MGREVGVDEDLIQSRIRDRKSSLKNVTENREEELYFYLVD